MSVIKNRWSKQTSGKKMLAKCMIRPQPPRPVRGHWASMSTTTTNGKRRGAEKQKPRRAINFWLGRREHEANTKERPGVKCLAPPPAPSAHAPYRSHEPSKQHGKRTPHGRRRTMTATATATTLGDRSAQICKHTRAAPNPAPEGHADSTPLHHHPLTIAPFKGELTEQTANDATQNEQQQQRRQKRLRLQQQMETEHVTGQIWPTMIYPIKCRNLGNGSHIHLHVQFI